jgi:PhnB protein
MSVKLNPYISFRTNAREAMEFYKSVFGGELTVSTFGESNAAQSDEEKDLLMHAVLETDFLTLMASDTMKQMERTLGDNISLSLNGESNDEVALREIWEKLAQDGTVAVPLDKAPWGDTFGMLTDKFDVHWMINIAGSKE